MGPVLGALLHDDFGQDLVFLLGPGALREVAAVDELEPAGVALDLRLALQQFADSVPAILTEFLNIFEKLGVLIELQRRPIINDFDKTYLFGGPLDAVLGVALAP